MALLRRKDDEDEEEYEDDEEEFRKRRRIRRVKDLHPGNKQSLSLRDRKHRKEPPKPWGKRERILVFAVLAITAGLSGLLYLSSRAWKLPGLPRIKLPSISLPFSGGETLVIEGDKQRVELRKSSESAVSSFNAKIKNLTGVYSLYVIDLNTGISYGVNEDEEFEPASLNKLPTLVGMYMEEEAGRLDLGTEYSLKNSDKLAGSGSLYGKPIGTVLTYRDLIRYMAHESDNTAYNIARRILGEQKIKNIIDRIGLTDTVVLGDNQKTTPKDIATLFEKLWKGELINESNEEELLQFLTDTIYEEHLAKGIPKDVGVAHKYGREIHVVNDAGIVFAENLSEPGGSPNRRPYVVVIMTKGVIDAEADAVFPELSKIVYQSQAQN